EVGQQDTAPPELPPSLDLHFDWDAVEVYHQEWRFDHSAWRNLLHVDLLELRRLAFRTVKHVGKRHHMQTRLAKMMIQALSTHFQVLKEPMETPGRAQRLQIITVFRYLLPSLLLSYGGASGTGNINRASCFQRVETLQGFDELRLHLIASAKAQRCRPVVVASEERTRKKAAELMHQLGGMRKASQMLASLLRLAPATEATLTQMREKHPLARIPRGAERDAEVAAALTRAAIVREEENTEAKWDWESHQRALKEAVTKASNHAAPGPEGLRYSHLRDACLSSASGPRLLALMTEEWLLLQDSPDLFGELYMDLYMSAILCALGVEKPRPLGCGTTLRRIYASANMCLKKQHFAEMFAQVGQFAVGQPCGVELAAAYVQAHHHTGGICVKVDGANAFNAACRV
ncbi:unnamed protein product, partial [Chrysoparadoxa australica]